jgi:hypothetical protein
MAGKLRHARAVHETGHAVIGRKLGLAVAHVHARSASPEATTASAAYVAQNLDVADLIAALEDDAKVALAGHAANGRELPGLREHPHLLAFDLFAEDDVDTSNTANAIYQILCLKAGQPFSTVPDEAMKRMMEEVYLRLVQETAILVDQHWPIIARVAKHLERHGRIDTQAELDDLIERAERQPRAL